MDRKSKSDIGGFSMVPDWILYADITPVTLKIWCVLARFANRDDFAFPTIETIAKASGLSIPTLRRALKELEGLGAIEIVSQYDENGRQRSNGYFLNYVRPSGEGIKNETLGGTRFLEGEGTSSLEASKENETHINETHKGDITGGVISDRTPSLIEEPPALWWIAEADRLIVSTCEAIMNVPKFAKWGPPEETRVRKLVADLRDLAPNDEAVSWELDNWQTYNRDNKKKGGAKDAIAALRNWYSSKTGRWAVQKKASGGGGSSKNITIEENARRRLEMLDSQGNS